jgi:hypothetical protein
VAFTCRVGNAADVLVAAPSTTVGRRHVYARTIGSAASIEMIDVSPDGTAEGSSVAPEVAPAFSTDNRLVAYVSPSTNLTRSTGCTPACLTLAGNQIYVRDRTSVAPELRRSFAVSVIRTRVAATSPNFVGLSSSLVGTISLGGPFDRAVVGFSGAFTGSNWSQLPTGWTQMMVAPAGTPAFQ